MSLPCLKDEVGAALRALLQPRPPLTPWGYCGGQRSRVPGAVPRWRSVSWRALCKRRRRFQPKKGAALRLPLSSPGSLLALLFPRMFSDVLRGSEHWVWSGLCKVSSLGCVPELKQPVARQLKPRGRSFVGGFEGFCGA